MIERVIKGPPLGPCSACGDGDVAMEYHNHEPLPASYTVVEIEQLAQEWAAENEATTDARWVVRGLIAWLKKQEQEVGDGA